MSWWLWVLVIFLLSALLSALVTTAILHRLSRLEGNLRDLEDNTPPFTDWRRTLERNKPRTR